VRYGISKDVIVRHIISKDVIVRHISMALDSLDWNESASSEVYFTFLRMISEHFKLNFKQHKMFISVGLSS
jgi:hypothetical protein